jgi:NAD(P)-dependent dehydrogenase (short-subunit alcohol dehydrogenase family)
MSAGNDRPADRGVALITGASRGIGAATARLAAKRGYDVAVNYVANEKAAAEVVRDVEAAGRRALAVKGDVAREADIVALFDAVEKKLGPIAALVNNAGIAGKTGRVEDVTADMVKAVLDLNVFGALICAREAVRRMSTKRGGKGGVIVNVSSGAATRGSPNSYVWYAASKAALDAITLGLGLEVAGEGIRVVGMAAGVTETEIHEAAGGPERLQQMAKMIPLGRVAQPEEMAEAILWLMSDGARYCTATTLRAGGGL